MIHWLFQLLSRYAGSAMLVSLVLVAIFASQIRAPQYAGSISDEVTTLSPALLAAEEVAAARGDQKTLLVIVDASEEPIRETLDRLDALSKSLEAAGIPAEVRSLNVLRDQLFVFGLDPTDSIFDLLRSLRDTGHELSLVSRSARSYSVAVAVAGHQEADALSALLGLDFGGTGSEVLAGAGLEIGVASGLRRDLRILIPGIVFVMLATIWTAFRQWRALILPAYASVASAIVTFGVLSMLGVTINLVTLLALPIVLIVALANSCHFLARVDRVGGDRDSAVHRALSLVAVPYLVSCLTTAVALASLSFNVIDPIQDLGYVTSTSLLSSFVLILLAAPWSLRWYLGASVRPPSRLYHAVSAFLHRWRRYIAAALVAGAVAGLLAAPSVKIQSDPRIFFPDHADFTRAFEKFEDQFYVFAPLRVLIRSADDTGINVEMLQFASSLRTDLDAMDGVIRTSMGPAAGDRGFLITAYVADDTVEKSLAGHVAGVAEAFQGTYRLVQSSSMMVYETIDGMAMASLGESLGISVLIIFGVILLLFHSVRVLLSSVIANAVPLLAILAAVWAVNDPLNLVTAFVFLVALGVIVDDTIHILWRDRDGEALSGSSIEYSVILSTVMLCLGLLLCQLSNFPTTRQFAAYCALALTGAVISDLTVLPALLRYQGWKRLARSSR